MPAIVSCEQCYTSFEAKRSDARFCSDCRVIRARDKSRRYEDRNRQPCDSCGAVTARRSKKCLACENKTRVRRYTGENNPNWQGGFTRSGGYVYRRVKKGSPAKGKGALYKGEHILVWEEVNNRKLPNGWVVHHLNGVKDDNRPENLAGMPRHHHHQHPREALKPYEQRIKALENALESMHAWQSMNVS